MPVTISRTGFTGDLGFELTVPSDAALTVLDAVLEAGKPHSMRPFGEEALMTLRIEAGLPLIDVEWHNSRLAPTDQERVTPTELGLGWMLRGVMDDDRAFIGGEAIRRELREGTSRWATTGIVVDWQEWDDLHREAGLFPPKDPTPLPYEPAPRRFVIEHIGASALPPPPAPEGRSTTEPVGYVTSFCYSPVLQRHIGIARVRPDLGRPGHCPAPGDHDPAPHQDGRRGDDADAVLRPRAEGEHPVSSANQYDAIVVGGGHNGLTNAAYLAKSGLRTLVLERQPMVGGAAITEELMPGFHFTTFSYALSLLRPEIIQELDLVRHGFMPLMMPGGFHPTGDGDHLLFGDDHAQNVQEIRRHSRHDADAYERYHHDLDQACRAVRPLFDNPPPDVFSKDPDDAADVAWLLDHLGGIDKRVMHDVVRLLTGSAADWIEDYFEHPAVAGYHASSSIIGSKVGPMSPGSGLVLLFHKLGEHDGHLGSWAFHKGGNGGFTQVLARAAEAYGAEIRLEAAVTDVITEGGRAVRGGARGRHGAPRAGGGLGAGSTPHVHRAGRPARAARRPGGRGGPDEVPRGLGQGQLRPRRAADLPGAARHDRALRRLPQHRPDHRVRRARLRRLQVRLVLRAALHRRRDPVGRRPRHGAAGQARAVVLRAVRAVELRGSDWETERDAFGDKAQAVLEEHFPGFGDLVLRREVVTPVDIEERTGLSEGNIFAGEFLAPQMYFFRPAPGWSRYATPIEGYYQCGSGTHPGGCVIGSPGRMAAQRVLRDREG